VTDERQPGVDRRSGQDRRSVVDSRPIEEQRLVGERRSNFDRRSVLIHPDPQVSPAENFARQALSAHGGEQKLDLLAQAILQLISSVDEIERRIKSVQQNMAGHRL
jgi:hypothetical protein